MVGFIKYWVVSGLPVKQYYSSYWRPVQFFSALWKYWWARITVVNVSKYVNGEILFIPFHFVAFRDSILCLSFECITIDPYWIVTTFPLRGSPEGRKVPHKQTSTQYNRVAHKCGHFFRAWVRLTLSSCSCSPGLIAVPFPCNLNVCIASSSFVFFPTQCRCIPFSCCCGTQPQFPTVLHKWPSVVKKMLMHKIAVWEF